ncbi:MAG TPA: DUF4118 domain-containing protein, partial [Bryobacteraceae bacterium]|nr:DUF4118 domain-containing protein [Bryobacteraceae bacterium]
MVGKNISGLTRLALHSLPGCLGVAVITGICFRAHLNIVIPGLLYLLVVVAVSLWGGFGPSVLVSVMAVTCLEFFFVPPVLEWQIDDPEDGVALIVYLLTSLVITRLASKARDEARIADQRRRDVGLLYETASRLHSLQPEIAAASEPLQVIRDVFGLQAVCFFDFGLDRVQFEGTSIGKLPEMTRDFGIRGEDYHDGNSGVYIRSLYAGKTVTGAVGFEGHFEDESALLPLSALAATAIERMRSYRNAKKAAAEVQAESLRSAVLDALAHEFKTPLAIILTAAGALRETVSSPHRRAEMTEIIEDHILRLNRLTTRLLRLARLDGAEVSLRMEPT